MGRSFYWLMTLGTIVGFAIVIYACNHRDSQWTPSISSLGGAIFGLGVGSMAYAWLAFRKVT